MTELADHSASGIPPRWLKICLALTLLTAAPRWPFRSIELSDAPALSALMYAAYKGTIDDEGETEEVALRAVEVPCAGGMGRCWAIAHS